MSETETGGAGAPMPRYRCHKEVWALKIANIEVRVETGEFIKGETKILGATVTPADAGYAPFEVDSGYMAKHKPQIGGYYVVYADGYKSYSPAKAFEEGYTRTDCQSPAELATQLEHILAKRSHDVEMTRSEWAMVIKALRSAA